MKRITILGATGSIGTQCLDIVAQKPDLYEINYLTTNTNIELLTKQCKQYSPKSVVVANERAYHEFRKQSFFKGQILCGEDGLLEAAADNNCDMVIVALVGFAGLRPTIQAIKSKKTIALANKETLVVAGKHIIELAKENNVKILPVDSEHSAIFQCLTGEVQLLQAVTAEPRFTTTIDKLILTASGGPFFEYSKEQLKNVTAHKALEHPTWKMGNKVTIDSATMMNKGFEVIEAHWLFGLPQESIEVVIHRQSIVHSMVQFIDGTVKAVLSPTDMRFPIAYALSYPERLTNNLKKLDFSSSFSLDFCKVPIDKFPCLNIAYQCLKKGGNMATIVNAANEIAVQKFINDEINFLDIPKIITQATEKIQFIQNPSLNDLFDTNKESIASIS